MKKMSLAYLFDLKLNKVIELDIPQTDYKNMLESGFYRKVTPLERMNFVRNRKPDLPEQLKTGLLDVYFLAPEARKDGHSTVSEFMVKYAALFGVYLNRNYTGQKIGLLYNHPHHIDELKTPYKIIYTGFESTKMPKSWKQHLLKADEIWTFSKFCKKVMKQSLGLDSKVFLHGIDTGIFKFKGRSPLKNRPFTFLHYDAFKWRKGFDLVLSAFEAEFKEDEKVKLILKTSKEKALPLDYRNVEVIKGGYTQQQMAELLSKVDSFVYPSRGEGFGMPPLEALAMGVRPITVNAHGISDYFNPAYMDAVKTKKIPAKYDAALYKGQDLGYMFQADVDNLRKEMRKAFEKRTWGKDNSIFAEQYNAKDCVEKMCKRLKKIKVDKRSITPQLSIIVLSYNALKWTKRCLESIKCTQVDYEVILVDNNSTDGSREWLANNFNKMFPNSQLILNNDNAGVAGGRNIGLRASSGIYCVFLDNDTEVSKGWEERILAHFRTNPEVWVVGHAGNFVESYSPLVFRAGNRNVDYQNVDVVAGYCFAFPRHILQKIGYQYEGLGKFWHEDLEFCGRVRKYGKYVIEDRKIPIVHYEHKSAGENVKTHEEVKKVHEGFYEKAKKVGKHLSDDNITTIYRGFNKPNTAYSIIADNLTENLRELGMNVFRKEEVPTLLSKKSKSFDLCNGFYINYRGYSIGFLHSENTLPPKEWQKDIATLDYAFTASPSTHLSLINGGLPKQKLINHTLSGFDESTYNFDVEPAEFIPGTKIKFDKFTYLSVGAAQPRKGTDILIKAFVEAFPGKDLKVRLLIKNYNYGKHLWVLDEIAKYNDVPHAEIIAIYEDWTPQELASVYKAVSMNGVYVSPHRAEGFGMTQLEAIACGCRIGASQFGGVGDNLKYLLKFGLVWLFVGTYTKSSFHNNEAEPFYEEDEKPEWFEPDINFIKQFMHEVYKEPYDVLMAEKASSAVINLFGFKEVARTIWAFLKSNLQGS